MTTSLTERFKAIRQELAAYGDMDYRNEELRLFDKWAHQVTLSGALTTRNFDDIRALLGAGKRIEPSIGDQERVVATAGDPLGEHVPDSLCRPIMATAN
ncbi:hypothetical protein OIE68_07365 [Nocardia vinacea]|uniref:hypothetical protein n=1 Tax=Nocardia vinacea TaxID=96468 RepID=UPI002E0DF6D6|nr:hypothetical protein OIE68_07365 [Nocardia vinacea]